MLRAFLFSHARLSHFLSCTIYHKCCLPEISSAKMISACISIIFSGKERY